MSLISSLKQIDDDEPADYGTASVVEDAKESQEDHRRP